MILKDKDEIKDLFSKKLGSHKVDVRPDLWNSIQSQIGAGRSMVTSSSFLGKSILVKSIVGITVITTIGTGIYFLFKTEYPKIQPKEVIQSTVLDSLPNNKQDTIISPEVTIKKVAPEISLNDHLKDVENKEQIITTESLENLLSNKYTTIGQPSSTITQVKEGTNVSTIILPNEQTPVADKPDSGINNQISHSNESKLSNDGYVKSWNKTNVFTPNNDGVNDFFFLDTDGLSDFSIVVMDKNNQVVYHSDDVNFRWDGTNSKTGEIVPKGTYFYIVLAKDRSGNNVKLYDTLYLIK